MIHKHFFNGGGYSIAELAGARHFFAAAVPNRGDTITEQTENVLQTVKTLLEQDGVSDSVVMQSVFLRDIGHRDACRQAIYDFYGKELPATAYISQPPCDGKLLSIEVWGVARSSDEVEIERLGEDVVIARHGGISWAFVANVRSESEAASVYDRSVSAFRAADERLGCAGMQFDHVLRTWLYLGDITGMEGQTVRYLELNRARTDFYRNLQFAAGLTPRGLNKPVFPASTGIGAAGADVGISCIALRTNRPDVILIPQENPRQTASCDYAHQYGTESPKFSRAMSVVAGQSVAVFISGTASITTSETRHAYDLERQAQQTLDNIEALIAADNFRAHGFPGLGATLDDLALARVYLKRPEDYALAHAICHKRLGELPVIYAVADVCRPELLVEIEATAFFNRQG